jgi:DNA invertase Pin-like site-specific DNA recombinase
VTEIVGYVRRPHTGVDVAVEVAALTDAGATRIVVEDRLPDDRERPQLEECLRALSPGDTLLVTSAAHLASSVAQFVAVAARLVEHGVAFRSLGEPALNTGPGQAADSAAVFVALEGLRRGLVSVRTRVGMDAAAAAGRRPGRPTVMTEDRIAMAVELRRAGRPITHIARVLGVSANSVQRALAALERG